MSGKIMILAVTALLMSGCAPKITESVLMPAGAEGISGIRSVAVIQLYGNYGAKITPSVENVLASAEVQGSRYFTVADRQNLNRIMQEQKLQVSGVADEVTAVKLGRLTGVQGIFTGSAEMSVSTERYTAERSRCSSRDKKGKCTAYVNYTVTCIEKNAEIVFLPKLIDVSTALLAYSDRISSSSTDRTCPDSSIAPASDESLLSAAESGVLNKFRKQIAPYTAGVTFTLMKSDDGIKESEGRKLLKFSLDFAEAGRMDRACEMWLEGSEKYPQSPAFLHNLGLCSEIKADYDKALELYKRADRLTDEPDKVLGAALSRTEMRIQERELLKKQLQ
ncbi:hypothetical protein EP073_04135 [Geovibrio thiophilus]|uniref:Uncharacterized protein n=1 Tax=Geovibrio thiophilus TaxID=139438 RepID=A0A3R5UX51_9BACT|nr:CsgG/HfaB family protein [Geovibrio thiophilus]QAR32624.1 hypothetical protein EP073_04135 [Geovibrio thiophilus]